MKKYKILREFVDNQGALRVVGQEFDDYGTYPMLESLKQHGFIEEIKEDTHWRPKPGESAWFLDIDQAIRLPIPISDSSVNDICEFSDENVFKSRDTAEKVAKALTLFFEYLHGVDGTNHKLWSAACEARDAVVLDDGSVS